MDYDGHERAPADPSGHDLAFAACFAGQFAGGVQLAGQAWLVDPDVLAGSGAAWSAFPRGGDDAVAGVVERRNQAGVFVVASGDPEIYVSDAGRRQLRRLTAFRGPDVSPVWNPKTNAQIAWVSGRTGLPQIYIMDSDGANISG